jgi:hypothetical protein
MSNDENTSGRSIHQSTRTLEDAVAGFLADCEARQEHQKRLREKKDYSSHHISFEDMWASLGQLRAAYEAATGKAPKVPRSKYKREIQKSIGRGNELIETHESYGMVQINRTQSSGSRLFGSSIAHQHVFRLGVYRGQRRVVDTGESFSQNGRVPIVEIVLTANQFVEMITSHNSGDGNPCTLSSVEGVRMDPPPDNAGSELKLVRQQFEEELAETSKALTAHDKELATILEQKTFTKADKEKIRSVVSRAERLLRDSAPFILGIFGEHVEKMAVKGKLEVDSFIQLALHRAGIKAVRDSGGELLLGRGDGEEP